MSTRLAAPPPPDARAPADRRPRTPAPLRAVLLWPLAAPALAALGAVAWVLAAPASTDLAAQEHRASLGASIWSNAWFAGHHTPGYSVLFGPLAGALGTAAAGALAALAAAGGLAALARGHWGPRAGQAAALWLAAATTLTLLSGRLTFLLGVAVGAGALLALARGRAGAALALALATPLASPVAGAFAALAGAAWALGGAGDRRRRALGAAFAIAALAPIGVLGALFPQGGDHPFEPSAFWPALAAALAGAALLPASERTLRAGAALYALALVAAFALATPLGGNTTRLGALAAGPVVVGALGGRRGPLLVAALALPAAYWSLYPPVRDVARAAGDPSARAAYHAGVVRFLRSRPGAFRVEIPPTANQWEARYVAAAVPLARGWERQLDRRRGALFYDGSLDAARYRAWLDARAVAYVALPDAAPDRAGRAEARLVRSGLPYLREVWRDRHWRVLAVADPAPLASGGAQAVLEPAAVVLRAPRPGELLVRVHHTRWWRVTAGRACVRPARGGLTRVLVRRPGTVRLAARLRGPRCR